MPIYLMHCLAALLILLLSAFGVNSAEVRINKMRSTIILDGKIEKGDYDKVLNISKKVGPCIEHIFLASPGGNLREAMRIGQLVRQLRWSTEAPDFFLEMIENGWYNKYYGFKDIKEEHQLVCASSCFFIYAGGVYRSGREIGIHRPYLSDEDYARMSGNEAIGKSKPLASIVDDYLKEMNVSSRFSEAIFSIEKDSIRWLNDEELKELNKYIPGLEDWFNSRCGSSEALDKERNKILKRTGKWTPELDELAKKLFKPRSDCMDKLSQEMRQEAWDKLFGKN